MKKMLRVIVPGMMVLSITNIHANGIDFGSNTNYYDTLCSDKASYSLNKNTCDAYEKWKKDGNGQTDKIVEAFNDESKMTLDDLTSLLNKNRELISEKTDLYNQKKARIARNQAKVDKLTGEVKTSLALMQLMDDENQLIDIIMGSTNLDELLTKIDGIKAINEANIGAMAALQKTQLELKEDTKYLKEDLNTLKEIKSKQESLILEFQRAEADLYTNSNSGGKGNYNNALDGVDLSNIEDTNKGWSLPVAHANVSAGTWAYPGGGWHPGMDLALPIGSNLLAPADGVVLSRTSGGNGYGNHMVIAVKKDNYVYTILFAHLNGFKDGVTTFKKGDVIAYTGNTGNSTGPHVHVEVFRHNTASLSMVIEEFKKVPDYWFGLGYSGTGDAGKVQRLRPESVFKVSVGNKF